MSVHRTLHKKVNKHLKLRHHKHTGKLMAHKHTSYRTLFFLMLLPIGLMALVENIHADALDLGVTANVQAPIPPGVPTIDSPTTGTTVPTATSTVEVSGTCPVISPAILIAIYKGSTQKGSTTCTGAGTYSLTISLGYGANTILARVVTITGGIGNDSTPVTITRTPPPTPSPSPSPTVTPTPGPTSTPKVSIALPELEPQVVMDNNFTSVPGEQGEQTSWTFSIKGGETPFTVIIDWGDGKVETHTVDTHEDQTYYHTYEIQQTYTITAKVTDARGRETVYSTVAVSYAGQRGIGMALDSKYQPTPPVVSFIQQYMWQIYIGAFSALVFLWYLEHGGHLWRLTRR